MGFPELFEKTIGPIHFIPGIYPYGVSLLTTIHFHVPSLIFGPLVAKYLAENGVPGTFWKNYRPNSFHTWHLYLWGESLDPYTFSCHWPNFRPSGGQIFGRKWGFRNFLKKLLAQFISYLAFTLMGWVSWPLYIFMFLASFSALWWPNIWPKMGFPELFEKTIGPIHFIPGIYTYGVSLLTPIHFRVPSLIFGPLVAKYLADCKIEIYIGYFWMRWVVIRAGVYCPHLWAQLVRNSSVTAEPYSHFTALPKLNCIDNLQNMSVISKE